MKQEPSDYIACTNCGNVTYKPLAGPGRIIDCGMCDKQQRRMTRWEVVRNLTAFERRMDKSEVEDAD